MEKNSYKVITVLSLVIAVVALAIGFAAYTATLTIENATATATASNSFTPNVQYKQGTLTCKRGQTTLSNVAGSLNDATHAVTWTGAAVTLTGPGDSITCSATVENLSTFTAHLKSITIASPGLTCAPVASGVTLQNLTGACDSIDLTVTEDTASATADTNGSTNATSVSGVSIAAGGEDTVSFTIAYPANSPVTDGDFTITIPTITFTYSTAQ